MPWQKLANAQSIIIPRGSRLRFPAHYPYEPIVELMVFDPPGKPTLGLIVDTGYKAGLALLVLPPAAMSVDGPGISSDWLIKNWKQWIYPETSVTKVLLDLKGRKVVSRPAVRRPARLRPKATRRG